jgi:hypothetical protein
MKKRKMIQDNSVLARKYRNMVTALQSYDVSEETQKAIKQFENIADDYERKSKVFKHQTFIFMR